MGTTQRPPQDTGSTIAYPISGIKVDPDQLLADLNRMDDSLWTVQYDNAEKWTGIALYSLDGDAQNLRTTPRLPVYKTPAGEKCSYITNELLPQFGSEWLRVVFYRLAAGARVAEHRDMGTNRRILGITRFHIPIVTNDNVLMYLGGKPYHFEIGTVWYFDASARHAVENNSAHDRIHLVIDVRTSQATEALLKPDTFKDRLRLTSLNTIHRLGLGPTVCAVEKSLRYMGRREGRARIRARIMRKLAGHAKPKLKEDIRPSSVVRQNKLDRKDRSM
jgi:aspartyl/asparaginyl beta-hydroxylase